MIEQIRLWFYYMLFFSVTFENTAPYKNVVSHAEVRDEKGERMSKTKKNGIPFDEAVEKMGADAMRWVYCQQKPYTNVNFGYNIADQVKREFFLILWNSYRFFTQHANLTDWQPSTISPDANLPPTNIIDQWLLSRLNSTIDTCTNYLEKFSTSRFTKAIEDFVNDLSTWYIRRCRERTDNYQLLYHCFYQLSVLVSPVAPFIAETIFQNLAGHTGSSVHLQSWPMANRQQINTSLETEMAQARSICQAIHAQRQQSGIKIRQPLSRAIISSPSDISPPMADLIAQETNVKSLTFAKASNNGLRITLDTNLTPDLIAEGEYRDLVRKIQVLRKENSLRVSDKIKIFAPSWPKQFEAEILSKTVAISIEPSDSLSIQKV